MQVSHVLLIITMSSLKLVFLRQLILFKDIHPISLISTSSAALFVL